MQRTESTLAHYFSTITFNRAAHPDNRMKVMSAVFVFPTGLQRWRPEAENKPAVS
jgi:hypothetical protein